MWRKTLFRRGFAVLDNRRKDIRCDQTAAERFVSALGRLPKTELKDFRPAGDKCHQVVYKYTLDGEKLSVVYDTKAGILSVTAADSVMQKLRDVWPDVRSAAGTEPPQKAPSRDGRESGRAATRGPAPSVARETNGAGGNRTSAPGDGRTGGTPSGAGVKATDKAQADRRPQGTPPARKGAAEHAAAQRADHGADRERPAEANGTGRSRAERKPVPDGTMRKPDRTAPVKEARPGQKKAAPAAAAKKEKAAAPGTAGDSAAAKEEEAAAVTVKKVTAQRFEDILKSLKKLRGVRVRQGTTAGKTRADETRTYAVQDAGKQRVQLRYMPARGVLQLQGKRGSLFGDVQVIISGGDYTAAVKNYISVSGEDKRAGDMRKLLKKRLPDAYEYLSEPSKIDITIGLIDIYNNETRLADYSSLLTPPYRGLEKFISDLQKAQGIEVKMIGQAYDKPDGRYELKSGYKKRIKSVVYAEVMAALYTEYFARRNFYTHSDNSEEAASRMITDKKEVVAIFDHLLDTINYNCKKLKEIGFSMP